MSAIVFSLLFVALVIRLLWIRKKTKRWREIYLPLHDEYVRATIRLKFAKILGKHIEEAQADVDQLAEKLKHWQD